MALKLGDLSKVPPRQKVLLAVLFCGLVVTGYYYLYYREASQRIGRSGGVVSRITGKEILVREEFVGNRGEKVVKESGIQLTTAGGI